MIIHNDIHNIPCRGKWGKVMTRGKMIFRSTGFNTQMASFDK